MSRITRKFFRRALILVIAIFSIFSFVNGATAQSEPGSAKLEYITISSGQTLWALAEQLNPNADPQDWIQDLVNLNGLTSTELKPGQRIALP